MKRLGLVEKAARDHPEVVRYQGALAFSLSMVGYFEQGKSSAEEYANRGVTIAERLVSEHPGNVLFRAALGQLLVNRGENRLLQGKFQVAGWTIFGAESPR